VVLFATLAIAQAPPAAEPDDPPPKLNLLNLLNGGGIGEAQHLTLSGAFRIEKGSRRGRLTITAAIEPGWHIYSLTQADGGPQKSEIKTAESPSYKLLGRLQPDQPPHVKPPGVNGPSRGTIRDTIEQSAEEIGF